MVGGFLLPDLRNARIDHLGQNLPHHTKPPRGAFTGEYHDRQGGNAFGTSALLKATDELKTAVGGLREALTKTIKQGLDGIKASIDEIRDDTQRTSNSPETLSGRIDNLHSGIQGLRGPGRSGRR